MKICPHCERTFEDDNLNFCLSDGTPLAAIESQATVVIPRPSAETNTITGQNQIGEPIIKKRRTGLWIAVGTLVLLIGGGTLAGLLLFAYKMGNQQALANKPANNIPIATPKPAPTPKPAATPGTTPTPAATPTNGTANPTPQTDDDDEYTPITWTTQGSSFNTEVGRIYKFECPENGVASTVWGNDIYMADSSVCTAAVHAGVITLEDGGEITVEFRAGKPAYGSTNKHGITTMTYGESSHSFVVR